MKIAVIGAGWAGLAAAVKATQDGHEVTLFESARTPGGRARSVGVTGPDGTPLLLDNGQHILIGAYTDTLSLMRTVGVDPDAALLRLPLTLRSPTAPASAAPTHPRHLTRWPASSEPRAGSGATNGRCSRHPSAGNGQVLCARRMFRLQTFAAA